MEWLFILLTLSAASLSSLTFAGGTCSSARTRYEDIHHPPLLPHQQQQYESEITELRTCMARLLPKVGRVNTIQAELTSILEDHLRGREELAALRAVLAAREGELAVRSQQLASARAAVAAVAGGPDGGSGQGAPFDRPIGTQVTGRDAEELARALSEADRAREELGRSQAEAWQRDEDLGMLRNELARVRAALGEAEATAAAAVAAAEASETCVVGRPGQLMDDVLGAQRQLQELEDLLWEKDKEVPMRVIGWHLAGWARACVCAYAHWKDQAFCTLGCGV